MENNDNYSPLVKEYLDGYYMGFYKSLDAAYMSPISTEIDDLDKLGVLPKNDIDYITKTFNIIELAIISYKDSYPFDNEYCMNIKSIIDKVKSNKKFIEDNVLMEYIKETISMQYGFERYLSESEQFRSFIYDLAEKLNYKVYDLKKLINRTLSYITAYTYYYGIDKELIRKVSITFMCNDQKVVDTLILNGFSMKNVSLDQNYFETLISLIEKCSSLNEENEKVIL